MRTSVKKITLSLKLILPPIACIIFILLFQKIEVFKGHSFYLIIVFFGVVITLFNISKI